jgi:alkylation response protein AidB-like acyl-CoA dehydrogenase
VEFALTPDQQTYVDGVRAFARDRVAPRAADIDASAAFPRDLVIEAARLGLMSVTIPREWGGAGRDYVTYAHALEAVSFSSAVLAVILSVNNSLVAEPIMAVGTDAQKDRWLRRLASGDSIGAFALSEPDAGSDAKNLKTLAQFDRGEYVLNGHKVWVANAEAAEIAIVFARTAPGVTRHISAFLVPMATPGLRRAASDSLGVRGLGCMDVVLEDVRVGPEAVLGEIGLGFHLAMRSLEGGRVAIAAQALGVGQAALDEALAYARTRQAFGQPIGDFQAIQFQLADLATDLEAARLLMWRAADARDRAPHAALEAAMAKLQASEAAHRAADRAMQILASEGYRRGSRIERLFRDVRAAEIYQGTSEVQRMVIAEHVTDDR